MIISHQHQFIFIKTEKSAGTSLEIALSAICGPQDILTPISAKDEAVRKKLGFRAAQNYHLPLQKYTRSDWMKLLLRQRPLQYYNHIPSIEIMQYLDATTWKNYYKFCFERNPWDKVISWYYWANRNQSYRSIKEFILAGRAGQVRGFDLYTKGGICTVDKVYKIEELDAALLDISERLNLSKVISLPTYRAKSGIRMDKRHYRDILTKEEVDLIATIFAREIKMWNYSF